MDHVVYEHESRWTYGWCACAIAVIALVLLAVDLASAGPTLNREIVSTTYAAAAGTGATIQPSDPARALLDKIVPRHQRVFERGRFNHLALFERR